MKTLFALTLAAALGGVASLSPPVETPAAAAIEAGSYAVLPRATSRAR